MPEEKRECMELLGKILPDMSDVNVARLIGYAEGYADRAEQEARNAASDEKRSGQSA